MNDLLVPHYAVGFRTMSKLIMHTFSDFEVIGKENIIRPPYLLAVNHLQHPDAFCVASAIPDEIVALGAEKIRGTLIGRVFSLGAPVWIKQDSPDRKALKKTMQVIGMGYPVAMSPEGHRSKKPGLLPGKDGAAFFATRCQIPILPAGIWGTEKMFRHLRPQVRMVIGKPFMISPVGAGTEKLKAYTEYIMCAIAGLLPAEYRGYYANNTLIDDMKKLPPMGQLTL